MVIEDIFLKVCGRNIGDEVSQLPYCSFCLVGLARKAIFEGEATNRVIRLAEAAGVPVYIVHLSAKEALAEVRAARDRGSMAFAETCPQYLFLSLDDLGNGFNGAKFVCSPPLRPSDHWDDLWSGLVKDDLQLVATDHCPFDFHGQKELGVGDFRGAIHNRQHSAERQEFGPHRKILRGRMPRTIAKSIFVVGTRRVP